MTQSTSSVAINERVEVSSKSGQQRNSASLLAIFFCCSLSFASLLFLPQRTLAFSPSDLPNLKLWLDPAVGTYTNTTLVTPATTDGASVKGWADQSGQNNNATDTTGAVLKLNSNGINGHTCQ
jgi:hypothetical protein